MIIRNRTCIPHTVLHVGWSAMMFKFGFVMVLLLVCSTFILCIETLNICSHGDDLYVCKVVSGDIACMKVVSGDIAVCVCAFDTPMRIPKGRRISVVRISGECSCPVCLNNSSMNNITIGNVEHSSCLWTCKQLVCGKFISIFLYASYCKWKVEPCWRPFCFFRNSP